MHNDVLQIIICFMISGIIMVGLTFKEESLKQQSTCEVKNDS